MAILGTESFSGTGDLGANWTVVTGFDMPQQTGGICQPLTSNVNCFAVYSAVAWPDDQYAKCKVVTVNTDIGKENNILLRFSTSARTGYEYKVRGPLGTTSATLDIYRFNAGAATQLATLGSQTVNSGDILKGTAIGTTLKLYINDVEKLSVSDGSPITSGKAGIGPFSNTSITDAQSDDWEGGDFSGAITGLRPASCF